MDGNVIISILVTLSVVCLGFVFGFWRSKKALNQHTVFMLASDFPPSVTVPRLIGASRGECIRVVQYKITAKGARKMLRGTLRQKPLLKMDILLDQEVALRKAKHWMEWKQEFGSERLRFFVPRAPVKMHCKIIVFDNESAFLGSSNLTNGGWSGTNVESYLIVKGSNLLQQIKKNVDRLFDDAVLFDPSVAPGQEQLDSLARRPAPKVSVSVPVLAVAEPGPPTVEELEKTIVQLRNLNKLLENRVKRLSSKGDGGV